MKRLLSLSLAMVLALPMTCSAAARDVTFKTDYFTLTLPDNWEIDTEDLESDEELEELGYFGESVDVGLVVAAYKMYYEDLKDFSLWNADESETQDYVDTILEDFEDDDPEWIENVMAGDIPFVLIKAADDDGEYLYADTMTNGYAIVFEAYVLDEDGENQYPLTEEYIEQFKEILETFQPAA